MVGRFVQNQKIDLLIHQHTQSQTALLTAGKVANLLEHILTLEQKRAQTVTGHLWSAVLFIEHGVIQAPFRMVEMDDLGQISPLNSGAKLDLADAILIAQQAFDKGVVGERP